LAFLQEETIRLDYIHIFIKVKLELMLPNDECHCQNIMPNKPLWNSHALVNILQGINVHISVVVWSFTWILLGKILQMPLSINIGEYYRVHHIILVLHIGQRTISNHFQNVLKNVLKLYINYFYFDICALSEV
jgi:hypothetical protein